MITIVITIITIIIVTRIAIVTTITIINSDKNWLIIVRRITIHPQKVSLKRLDRSMLERLQESHLQVFHFAELILESDDWVEVMAETHQKHRCFGKRMGRFWENDGKMGRGKLFTGNTLDSWNLGLFYNRFPYTTPLRRVWEESGNTGCVNSGGPSSSGSPAARLPSDAFCWQNHLPSGHQTIETDPYLLRRFFSSSKPVVVLFF